MQSSVSRRLQNFPRHPTRSFSQTTTMDANGMWLSVAIGTTCVGEIFYSNTIRQTYLKPFTECIRLDSNLCSQANYVIFLFFFFGRFIDPLWPILEVRFMLACSTTLNF